MQIIQELTLVKPNEHKAALASFLMVFVLMAAYFILRPVRDAMASDWTDSEVSLLWNMQLIISLVLVSIYGFAVSRLRLRLIVPLLYAVFAMSFLLFYVLTPIATNTTLVDKCFYLWVAAFSLFNLSVFWSFMADTFNANQGRRLFAIIGAGASAGALVGPSVPTLFADQLGLDVLMLIAAAGLLLVVPLSLYIQKLKVTELANESLSSDLASAKIGGQWWAGFKDVVSNPYLAAIGAFILLYVFIGSFVYFEQKNLLAEYSRAERTQILGGIDWIVNTLTFVFAFLITGRITNRLGMPLTLALLPAVMVIGLTVLAFAPTITVLLAVQVARRVGNYSITRPAREMLFSKVSTEERFKAKPVIDVVVYRGGDAFSGSIFAALTDGLGLGLAAMALMGSGVAAAWASVAVFLGRRYEKATTSTNKGSAQILEGPIASRG